MRIQHPSSAVGPHDSLREAGVEFDSIVGDLSSPRVVVNDDGAFAVDHERNTSLHYHPGVDLFEPD